MRIAFMNPTYWPEVRRGTERIIHGLGTALVERGHEVTLLTSHPGPRAIATEGGIRVDRARRLPDVSALRWYEPFTATIPLAAWRLVDREYDVAHAFYPADALAATLARRVGGPRFVFSIHGIPTRRYLVARRYRGRNLQRAIDAAAGFTVLSEAAAEPVRRFLLREPEIVPGGVDVEAFASDAARSETPAIVCAASLADPRKRGALLVEAFAAARELVPEARLLLAGGADLPHLGADRLGLPPGVERHEIDETGRLADAYASAWASVLPSVEEAFGLVMVESLAAGTPVVAARSGAAPEILVAPDLGSAVEPDDAGALAEGMVAALSAPPAGTVAAACRARAADYDWAVIAERFEGIYERALSG